MTSTSQEIISLLNANGVLLDETINPEDIDFEKLKAYLIAHPDLFMLENILPVQKDKNTGIEILQNYTKPSKKRAVGDFVSVFKNRFKLVEKILRTRQEMSGVTTIKRAKQHTKDDAVTVIGMIVEKQLTKNNNFILTVEDMTDKITIIITQKNNDLFELTKDLVLDEIIGIQGVVGDGSLFVKSIIFPDVSLSKELKKSPYDEHLAIIGDLHAGSQVFMENEFKAAIKWLNGELGSPEQRAIAQKVKYAIFTGDLVEGVGVYPGQEKDLIIPTIKKQYDHFTSLIKEIRSSIEIIIIPGNHDAGRLAEPQAPLYKDYAGSVYSLPNVTCLSNPSLVTIGKHKDFSGFKVLLYHGGSLIYYSDNVPSIRAAGGQKRVDMIMEFLLKRRHLAPTHGSTLYLPDTELDLLAIDDVPDFFITGHIHRASVSNYRNVTLINGSCWTDTTEDQIKRGLEPQPCQLPVVNLKTRQVQVLNFLKKNAKSV
ncbi:MAG: metallophosphoesterase [Candidatus Woesearchaeota archaeon]|nr:MAG: metallophosphoesterase [Candidatus Woesearchaeota archaeon]